MIVSGQPTLQGDAGRGTFLSRGRNVSVRKRRHQDQFTERTQRKPVLLLELSGVFELRASTR